MRRTMEKTGLAVCIAVVACNAWADYPTVSDAAGLVEALEEHNSASGSTTIYLEPGNSSCARSEIALAQGMDDKRLSCRSR